MQLRDRLAYIASSAQPAPPRQQVSPPTGFTTGDNQFGQVYFRDQFFDLEHRHGKVPLASALRLDTDLLERLAPNITQEHLRDAAYLDIETSGLSGGTGTYAFLIGIGTFEALSFRVRQFFLAEPSGERAML